MHNLTRTFLLPVFMVPIAYGEPAQKQENACASGVSLSSAASATYTAYVVSITAYETYPGVCGGEFPGLCARVEYTVQSE